MEYKLQIALVGEKSEPLLRSIPRISSQKVVLFSSQKTLKNAKGIRNRLDNVVAIEEIEPYDMVNCFVKTLEWIRKTQGQTAINITGGTKISAIAAIMAAYFGNSRTFYLSDEGNIIEVPIFEMRMIGEEALVNKKRKQVKKKEICILEELERGSLMHKELSKKLGLKKNSLTYHMRNLIGGNFVEFTSKGREKHYHITQHGRLVLEKLRTLEKLKNGQSSQSVRVGASTKSAEFTDMRICSKI